MSGYCDPPVHSRFKPGQSGNPGGKFKGPSLARRVMELLDAPISEAVAPQPSDRVIDRVALSLVTAAMTGDKDAVAAIRTILERTDGAVPQSMGIAYEQGDPRQFLLDLAGRGIVQEQQNGSGNGHGGDSA